ncbi:MULTISPECIES: hypothetical protein [Oceanobacillus]|uniref:Uncharacterized protein n=1 Tax=Oceanobacillus neutriphilus TaxID=531815 RepID=A0ABQ2P3F2_9BACI|nr:hypothetical protein [Oceanobacillus neutriphilus]GGP17414.1 hypothetical protein GCM10011346_52940 [Oceanobacillus neutriphilus]
MDALDMYQEIETLQSAEKLTTKQKQRMKLLQSKLNYDKLNQKKLKRILSKKQDMKQSEILMLIESGVRRDQISKALGMNNHEFREYLRNIGVKISTRRSKG